MGSPIHQFRWALALALPFVLVSCDSSSKGEQSESEYEDAVESLAPKGLQQGPIRRAKISDELDARIRKFSAVFAEVYPVTHEEWLDGFKRDVNPENEVMIWEQMAAAYSKFLEKHAVETEGRSEAFGLLLVRSSTEDMESSYSKLKVLTLEQAKSVVSGYEAAARPITYQKAEQGADPNRVAE